MKMKSAIALWARASALAIFTMVSVACSGGGDNGGDPNPTPTPTPDPVATAPGDFAVTQFVLTNNANAGEVLSGEDFGLSLYFILNEDGSLTGAAQTPQAPPEVTSFTGNWVADSGTLTLEFSDQDGALRILSGSLGFDEEGDVVFQGSQTGGEPVVMESGSYTISSMEMEKIEPDVTQAALAGEWIAVSGTVFMNLNPGTQENLLEDGAGIRVVFEENGEVTIFNTLPGGGEDNFATTYTLIDNFHMTIVIDDEDSPIVYTLIDGVLTLYIYSNVEYNFDNDSDPNSVPASQVFVFEQS